MPEPLVDRIVRSQRWLDPLGDASQGAIGWVFKLLGSPARWLKSLLHGSFLHRDPSKARVNCGHQPHHLVFTHAANHLQSMGAVLAATP